MFSKPIKLVPLALVPILAVPAFAYPDKFAWTLMQHARTLGRNDIQKPASALLRFGHWLGQGSLSALDERSAAYAEFDIKDYKAARHYYRRHLPTDTDPVWTELRIAITYTKDGDLRAATEAFMAAHDRDAKRARGMASYWLGKENFGFAEFKSYEGNIVPHATTAFFELAEQKAKEGEIEAALTLVEQAARFDHTNARRQFSGRASAIDDDKRERALALLKAASAFDPNRVGSMLLEAWWAGGEHSRLSSSDENIFNARWSEFTHEFEVTLNQLKNTFGPITADEKRRITDIIGRIGGLLGEADIIALDAYANRVEKYIAAERNVSKLVADCELARGKEPMDRRFKDRQSCAWQQRGARRDADVVQNVSELTREFDEKRRERWQTKKQQQFERAIKAYDRLVAAEPAISENYQERAEVLALQLHRNDRGDYRSRAIADSTRALELNPRDYQSMKDRGRMLLKTGDLEGGVRDLKTYVSVYPGDVHNRAELVRALVKLGRKTEAKTYYDEIEKIHAGLGEGWELDKLVRE